MHMMQDRRRFLTTLSSAGAAGLVGTPTSFAQEAPPETTTIRLTNIPGICIAPQYVAEELLKSEGFTDVQYVDVVNTDIYPAFASSTVDISMAFVAPFIVQIDRKVPIVLLGGIHVGCFELFGQERVRAIRDLKGKVVAVPSLGSPHHTFVASMVAHVGLDPNKDINFVTHPVSESARLLTEGKVDALMGFPPVPQELREKKIGHVIVNSGVGPTLVAVLLLRGRGAPGVRSQAPGGDQAGVAGALEGDALLLHRARARCPHCGGSRLSLRLRPPNNERDSLRALARLRP